MNSVDYHVSTTGNDLASGSATEPFRTISRAAEAAQPGDVITVHKGVYRERVNPPRGGRSDDQRIVYRAADGERVVIKGSERITGWNRVEGNVWSVSIPNTFFGGFNPYDDLVQGAWYQANRPYHTGAVYLNGHWLKEAPLKSFLLPSVAAGTREAGRAELMNLFRIFPAGKNGKEQLVKEYVSCSERLELIQPGSGELEAVRIRDGMVMTFDVDFGQESPWLGLEFSSPLEGGLVDLYLGSADGKHLGQGDVGYTPEWHIRNHALVGLKRPLSGMHRVTLVFSARPPKQVDPSGSYWFAEVSEQTTTIWARFGVVDPNKELVEINVRRSVFYPDQPGRDYITVRGFTLEHAASPWSTATTEQVALVGTHWSRGWIIENNTIQYSTGIGVALGKYGDEYNDTYDYHGTIMRAGGHGWDHVGYHIVRNNHIRHCAKNGVHGSLGCVFSSVMHNEIHHIRTDHEYLGADTAGVKFLGGVDVLIEGNHIHHCEKWGGIWLDWMAQGARVTGNLLHDNYQDLFLEVNHGPILVDHNLMLSPAEFSRISSSVAFVHNLFCGNAGGWDDERRETPFFRPHSVEVVQSIAINRSDDRYFNNIFIQCNGPAVADRQGFDYEASGNVYTGCGRPGKHEQNSLSITTFDPAVQLLQEGDEWWLEIGMNPDWPEVVAGNMVTTEILGASAVTGCRFECRDGSAYRLDRDYSGVVRKGRHPDPGPFSGDGKEKRRVKAWPRTCGMEATNQCGGLP